MPKPTHQPMSDAAALPKGLAAVLQHSLLPKLSPAGLQACAQTCCELRQAVLEAPWGAWHSAWERAGMPPDHFTRSGDPCSSISRLARQHAAVRRGPAWCRTIQGSTPENSEIGASFVALQPDFANLASLCGPDVIVTPVYPADDSKGYTRCSAEKGNEVACFQGVWEAEGHGSPDGMFLVSLSYSGLSLYACRPTFRLVNTIKLTGEGKVVDWAPSSQQFSILTKSKVYVVSVPGHAGRAAKMHAIARLCPMSCIWSPCSSYIAVTTRKESTGLISRLILCVKQGTVHSRQTGLNSRHRALAWVQLGDRLSLASTDGTAPQPGEKLWLQDVRGSQPWGGFPAEGAWLQIGYRVAGGHRAADLRADDECTMLYNLTAAGLRCPARLACDEDSVFGRAAWAPGNGIWLALLGVKMEIADNDHDVEGQDYIQTACLEVVDGRSGQSAFEVVLLETSFNVEAASLMWSSSGAGLMVGLEMYPVPTPDSEDPKHMWLKKYFRFQ